MEHDKLIMAVNASEYCKVQIEGHDVEITPDPIKRGKILLQINGNFSNSCLPRNMRKLLREWKNGKRHIVDCGDGILRERLSILMVKHS